MSRAHPPHRSRPPRPDLDGPGQPGTRHHHGLLFRPDWEKVVDAAIDWACDLANLDPHRIALLGVSFGGQNAFMLLAGRPVVGGWRGRRRRT